MRSVEEIREALRRYRPEEIAAGTGLGYSTVRLYLSTAAINPRRTTVRLLSGWLDRMEAESQTPALQ